MPVSGGPTFFPPSMPPFWNAAALMQQQQQQQAQFMQPSPTLSMYMQPSFPAMHANMQAAAAAVANARNGIAQMAQGFGGQHCISPTGILQSPTFSSHCASPSPPTPRNDPGIGVGVLVWLSSQAGLIKKVTDDKIGLSEVKISFQLKDFCDQAVTDLTLVLRPGFYLRYQATSQDSHGQSWVANFVSPVHHSPRDSHIDIPQDMTANLESPPGVETGPPQLPKDPYHLEMEGRAIPMLLGIFERNGVAECQLSSFHCQISNCGDDDLYRYIGTSSLKRRQYLERRTHLFHTSSSDMVSLQPTAMYATVLKLVHHLLNRGGACLMQDLFDHFNSCPEIPLEAREMIGDGKPQFVRFLDAHPWLFAVFPSRVFVAARRQMPVFDYASFINEHFEDQDLTSKGIQSPSPAPSVSGGPPTPNYPPTMTMPIDLTSHPLPNVTHLTQPTTNSSAFMGTNWPAVSEHNNMTNGHLENKKMMDTRFKRGMEMPPPMNCNTCTMWPPVNNDVGGFSALNRHQSGSGAIGQEVKVKMIRRCSEAETQTETEPVQWISTRGNCVSNWASPPKGPLMVDAGVQAGPMMITTGCGPGIQSSESECSPSKATLSSLSGDTSSLSAPDSIDPRYSRREWSPWSPPLCQGAHGHHGFRSDYRSTWSGNSLGEGGFDPFHSPLSLMHNLKLDK